MTSVFVEAGEVVSLLGPSDAEKQLCQQAWNSPSGMIRLHDKLISSEAYLQPIKQRGIGYMFQDYALFPHLTVIENVVFGLSHRGSAATKRGLEVLEEVGIEPLCDVSA